VGRPHAGPGVKAKVVFPAVFSRHAAAYRDRITPPLQRGEAKGRLRVIALLGLERGQRVLDLASGPGTLTGGLAEAVGPEGSVVAADMAEGMLRLAREAAPANVSVVLMDAERLGLRAAAFDAVACGHGLQFLPDLGVALGEVRRVLRAGGRFAASFPATGGSRTGPELVAQIFAGLPSPPSVPDRAATLATLEQQKRVRAAVLGAGFSSAVVERVEEATTYSSPDELVSRLFGWWDSAWRLESLPESEQERVRALALEEARRRLGQGPITVQGASEVLFAVA
jgi:ubiquinone/menaquinone biosynthesis C-methylase UbiE